MSRLEEAIKNIVDVFLESAGNDTSKFKMGQDELKDMLDKEIQSPEIKELITPDDIEEAMQKMDKNQDGEVNFKEYSRCVMNLAKALYQSKTGRGGKKGRGRGKGDDDE